MKKQRHLMLVIVALIAILIATGCQPCQTCPPAPMTTVLLLRHAERANDSLKNPEGLERADKLAHVALKAGVTAIYATTANRTQQTVQPLAGLLGVEVTIYTDTQELVDKILLEHNGDVVLVAGHSPTVPEIIDALGGDGTSCEIGNEYDNLCIVIIYRPGKAKVVNLQYGEASP
jgi:broad specificity phosphatase PhoE